MGLSSKGTTLITHTASSNLPAEEKEMKNEGEKSEQNLLALLGVSAKARKKEVEDLRKMGAEKEIAEKEMKGSNFINRQMT